MEGRGGKDRTLSVELDVATNIPRVSRLRDRLPTADMLANLQQTPSIYDNLHLT